MIVFMAIFSHFVILGMSRLYMYIAETGCGNCSKEMWREVAVMICVLAE